MAVPADVQAEADKFLEKCGEELRTEPKKLACKINAVSFYPLYASGRM